MKIQFEALPTAQVERIRRDMVDSYGGPVERQISDGDVYPCRHCLGVVPKGAVYLVLAHRPFRNRHAYAETGPIFLCEASCRRAPDTAEIPSILRAPDYILRGYGADERIVYGTGQVTATDRIAEYAADLLSRADIAFVDIRSARNNCFQCRMRAVVS